MISIILKPIKEKCIISHDNFDIVERVTLFKFLNFRGGPVIMNTSLHTSVRIFYCSRIITDAFISLMKGNSCMFISVINIMTIMISLIHYICKIPSVHDFLTV